jgi:hypothetical protein
LCQPNSNSNAYSHGNGHTDWDADGYSKTYTDTKVHPGTKASADSSAAPVGFIE